MPKLKPGEIRRLRELKCLSQEQLSRRAGIATRTLQRAERGETARLDTIALLAEALQVPATSLLEQEQNPSESVLGVAPEVGSEKHIPVVLHRMSDGKALLDTVSGSMAMLPEIRGVTESSDADSIGKLLDWVRDFTDVDDDLSFTDQLRYGLDLTQQLKALRARGWWVLAGKKHHALIPRHGDTKPIAWTTCVILVARADDSAIVHREDGEPVALVFLPPRFNFA